MKQTKLTIIIPAYNEAAPERNFLKTLESYYVFLRKVMKKDFDIGIIVNNSSDGTAKIARKFAREHRQAWWHEIKGYSGKGGAVMRGFDIAQGEWIGFVDADNSTTVEEFYRCLKKGIHRYDDGVIASRRMILSEINPPRRWTQNLSSWLFNVVVNILFRVNCYDTQCGCKIFSKECAKFLVKNHTEVGWNFDVDLLYLCRKNGFEINEFPINWKDTEGGKINTWEGIKAVLGLFKYRLKNWKVMLT